MEKVAKTPRKPTRKLVAMRFYQDHLFQVEAIKSRIAKFSDYPFSSTNIYEIAILLAKKTKPRELIKLWREMQETA